MAYEPAINTTESKEKTRYWLEKAIEAAYGEGLAIIGFIVSKNGDEPVFEPFASHPLAPETVARLLSMAARQMLNQDEIQ